MKRLNYQVSLDHFDELFDQLAWLRSFSDFSVIKFIVKRIFDFNISAYEHLSRLCDHLSRH